MSKKHSTATTSLGLMIALSLWAVAARDAIAQGGHPGHEQGAHAGGHHDHGSEALAGGAATVRRSPHGGQMTVAGPFCFEAVYRPKETRLYLYGADHRAMSARGVQGQISLRVRGNDKVYRFPLEYVAPQAGSPGHDYVAAAVDVSRVRDGDMTVAFELVDLPDARQPEAAFMQTFALSQPQVTLVMLDESDRPRIAQQEVCAVSGGRLGSMGTPVKVLIGDQPVYLCCKGCLGKVEENPAHYLAKAAELRAER
ncbi:MAG: hypothetical protein A2V98_10625 [Planctomycetes bacterium RBG_16_64_12]|nr:MAG: hypothetical protein A2V98_10625 [Planctomycetes bacterium RBG_16_64_12]